MNKIYHIETAFLRILLCSIQILQNRTHTNFIKMTVFKKINAYNSLPFIYMECFEWNRDGNWHMHSGSYWTYRKKIFASITLFSWLWYFFLPSLARSCIYQFFSQLHINIADSIAWMVSVSARVRIAAFRNGTFNKIDVVFLHWLENNSFIRLFTLEMWYRYLYRKECVMKGKYVNYDKNKREIIFYLCIYLSL